jgi:hypothetical protein
VWGHVPTTAKHEVTYQRRPPTTGPVTEVSPFVMWKNAGAVLFGCLALPRAHCEPRPLRPTIRPSRLISASEACNEWSLALGTEHGPAFVVLNTILSRTLSDNYNPEVRLPLMSGPYQTRRWREMDSNHRPPQEPSRTSESPVDAALPRSVEVLVGRAVLYEPTPIKGIRVWPSQIRRW